MKKYLLIALTVLSFSLMSNVKAADLPSVTDHEKVTIYLFWGNGCPHCADFIEYFSDKYTEYEDYFEIVGYETYNSTDNYNLMLSVKEEYDEEVSGGVPFIVVGDYSVVGYGDDSSGEEIIEEALNAYQDDSYEDRVLEVIETENSSAEDQDFEGVIESEATGTSTTSTDTESTDTTEEDSSSDAAAIIIIFVVVIVGFGGLVYVSRKKN